MQHQVNNQRTHFLSLLFFLGIGLLALINFLDPFPKKIVIGLISGGISSHTLQNERMGLKRFLLMPRDRVPVGIEKEYFRYVNSLTDTRIKILHQLKEKLPS